MQHYRAIHYLSSEGVRSMARVSFSFYLSLLCLSGLGQISFQNFQIIDADAGLSQNSVYALYQDRKGFLWLGTADGLNRYDGKQIKTFKASVNLDEPSNSNFIRGNIAEDSWGNIWYTSQNGLYMLDIQTQTIVKKHSYSKSEFYLLVFIDSTDTVWMQSWLLGFASFHSATGQHATFPMPFKSDPKKWQAQNFTHENGKIWFAMQQKDGVHKFHTATKTFSSASFGEDILFVKSVTQGFLQVKNNQILFYDSASREPLTLYFKEFSNKSVRDLAIDGFGRLWVLTAGGQLWCCNMSTSTWWKVNVEDLSASFIEVTRLLIDNHQNLWVGTDGAGVFRFDLKTQPINLMTGNDLGLKDFFIKSVVEDWHGNVWVHSFNNPLHIFNPASRTAVADPALKKINAFPMYGLTIDNEKRIWVQNEKSIFIIEEKGNIQVQANIFRQYYPTTELVKVERISAHFLLATTNIGNFILKENEMGKFDYGQVLIGNNATKTDDSTFWLGTRNYGLHRARWRSGNKLQLEKDFFSELDINNIHVDEQDNNLLWLASDKGLIKFNPSTLEHQLVSDMNGHSSGFIYGILEAENQLWFSTNSGIVRFDKLKNVFTTYTVTDGLQNNEFNTNAFHKGFTGTFYFGGVKGLNWFKPHAIVADSATIAAVITEITVSATRVPRSAVQNSKLELPHDQNDVNIYFAVFDYSKPEGNKVRYRLEGWDEEQHISNAMMASYHNLPPGKYTFVYSAATSNNHWSKDQRLEIVIQPPFWETWWFSTIVVLTIVSIIALVVGLLVRQRYKLRIVELEKQNELERERRRISMEMHDDIGANLTRIVLMSEAAKHKREKEESLNQIAETSRHVVNSMSEIIWSLNPDNRTFEQLMGYLRNQLHNLLESSGIDYHIDLPFRGDFVLTNAIKRNTILLLKEAVHNAIKHSKADRITVTGEICNHLLNVQVRDNGIGLDVEKGMLGNGLKNMKSRCFEIGGEIAFVSAEEGTTVTISIPIQHPDVSH